MNYSGSTVAWSRVAILLLVLVPVSMAQSQAPVPALPALTLQVLLDRAHFSSGQIDGLRGGNTTRALNAWAKANGKPAATEADAIAALGGPDVSPTVKYAITEVDVAGPFTPVIPTDMMERAALQGLLYTSPLEALAERFHASPRLLQSLNPVARFVAGEEIQVPNVADVAPLTPMRGAKVIVSKRGSSMSLLDPEGKVLFFAPVTSGSEHDPLPIGQWTVTGIARNPSFNYNPDLFWDADPAHAKAKIPAGPNNPVGLVWIDITKPHYGLHGTPEPGTVGHTSSHGCVRLTNWDAMTLASLVARGTVVDFVE